MNELIKKLETPKKSLSDAKHEMIKGTLEAIIPKPFGRAAA